MSEGDGRIPQGALDLVFWRRRTRSREQLGGRRCTAAPNEKCSKHIGEAFWLHVFDSISKDRTLATSCSYRNKFVLVWDTATGTVLRQLDIEDPARILPRAVAISSSGDRILCAGRVGDINSGVAFVNLWGPSKQVFLAHFKRQINKSGTWTATILSAGRLHGAILAWAKRDEPCETYEWALSGSDPKIVITPTAESERVFRNTNRECKAVESWCF
jgi:hypothetical protein